MAGCAAVAAPSSPPTSTASPSTAAADAFTDAELARACIDATASAFGDGVHYLSEQTRVEAREVEPEWLVLVPVDAGTFRGEAQCTVGGTPDELVVEMSTASTTPLPESQIENLIRGENEGGTQ